MLQRLVREGLVLRSLTFPTVLIVGTLMLTIGFVAWLRWQPTVALSPDLADLAPTLLSAGMKPVITSDPQAMVDAEEAWGGAEDDHIWLHGGGPKALALESAVRTHAGTAWRPDANIPHPSLDVAVAMGQRIVVLLGVLFGLYGVVFGAGMVARDRDNGTFEIELALPVPRWVHGAARVLTGTLALFAFLGLGVLMVEAVIGLADVGATLRHALAGACGSTCIGLIAIGRGGLKTGFTGPLATGMSLATALVAIGIAGGRLAAWVPLASFASGASGWEALLGATVLALFTTALFTWRSAKT